MKAQRLHTFGSLPTLDKIAAPEAGPGEVLIAIHAAALNPADVKIAEGSLAPAAPTLPATLGMDLSGEVVGIGAGVTDFSVGDAVYGCAGGVKGRPGSLAELIVADARLLAPKPATLSMREAAALPLVTITAWEGLVDRAHVAAGDTVLVHAGAGGVGHVAVQLARAQGARVAATVSTPEKAALVRGLGAEPILYREETAEDYVARLTGGAGFDIVYDTVGGDVLSQSALATRLYGQLISCAAWESHDLVPVLGRSLSVHGIFMLLPMLTGARLDRHGAILREAAALADKGLLRPILDPQRFALAGAGAAFDHLASGKAIGKVVLDIR